MAMARSCPMCGDLLPASPRGKGPAWQCASCGAKGPALEIENDADTRITNAPPKAVGSTSPKPKSPSVGVPTEAIVNLGKPNKARARGNPRDLRPEFVTEDGAYIPPLLEGSTDPDDDNPYTVRGSGLKPCPHCKGELPLAAVFCVHCGMSLAGDAKANRQFEPIERSFEEGWTLQTRLYLFAALQIVNVFIVGGTLFASNSVEAAVTSAIGALVFIVAPLAFILGSFQVLTVKRSYKGKTRLFLIHRYCFIPTKPKSVPWPGAMRVSVIGAHQNTTFDWVIFLYLLLSGILPGILFYNLILHPIWLEVTLLDSHGSKIDVVFRTTNERLADEVAETVAKACGLGTAYRM